jgi:hypothetical protein
LTAILVSPLILLAFGGLRAAYFLILWPCIWLAAGQPLYWLLALIVYFIMTVFVGVAWQRGRSLVRYIVTLPLTYLALGEILIGLFGEISR